VRISTLEGLAESVAESVERAAERVAGVLGQAASQRESIRAVSTAQVPSSASSASSSLLLPIQIPEGPCALSRVIQNLSRESRFARLPRRRHLLLLSMREA